MIKKFCYQWQICIKYVSPLLTKAFVPFCDSNSLNNKSAMDNSEFSKENG